jgi:hypothetical protein
MNALLNALEELYDTVVSVESHDYATRIRSILIDLLHKNEFNTQQNDPNHPYSRFAVRDDAEGNRLRLFQAVQERVHEDEELQATIDMMFETPSTDQYEATVKVLRKYMRYVNEHRSADSSESDSD